jgi:hypothetical protein
VVHAGTAVSTSTRGQPNQWNIVRLSNVGSASGLIEVQPMHWDRKKFVPAAIERYAKSRDGWVLKKSGT